MPETGMRGSSGTSTRSIEKRVRLIRSRHHCACRDAGLSAEQPCTRLAACRLSPQSRPPAVESGGRILTRGAVGKPVETDAGESRCTCLEGCCTACREWCCQVRFPAYSSCESPSRRAPHEKGMGFVSNSFRTSMRGLPALEISGFVRRSRCVGCRQAKGGIGGDCFRRWHRYHVSHETDGHMAAVCGVPKGTRTPVFGVRGRCPRPLDDGDPVTAT